MLGTDLDDLLNGGSALDALVPGSGGLSALLGDPDPVEAPVPDVAPDEAENDPFGDVQYTGDLETDAAQELTAAQAAFRDRAKTYKKQRLLVEDSEFWVAVCFRTREDKERFLRDHGLIHLGDKYLDGYRVDAALTKEN